MTEVNVVTPMWTDVVQALGTFVTALATIFVLYQIKLTREQIASAEKWNKFNATFAYFTSDKFIVCERAVAKALRAIGVDFYRVTEPLSPETVNAIWGNDGIYVEVRNYLNFLENYATTVNRDRLDEDCAYSIAAGAIIRLGQVFEPYIEKWRREANDHELFTEIQALSKKWRDRFNAESTRYRSSMRRAASQLNKERSILERYGPL
jgi:hypothetical protein